MVLVLTFPASPDEKIWAPDLRVICPFGRDTQYVCAKCAALSRRQKRGSLQVKMKAKVSSRLSYSDWCSDAHNWKAHAFFNLPSSRELVALAKIDQPETSA